MQASSHSTAWLMAVSPRVFRQELLRHTEGRASGAEAHFNCILVVEDDYFVALELEHRLLEAGFEVVGPAGTADEAIALATSKEPDLAIMDIRLAGLRDGIDAAIELLTRFGIPTIFATAHADAPTRRRAEQARPLGWLRKPYSAQSLLAMVGKVQKD